MRTWIVVCDASRARLFSKGEDSGAWVAFEELTHPASRAKGIDLVSDRSGRVQQSQAKVMRPGMDPRTDPRTVESERFAAEIATLLDRAHANQAFERLVIVAPARFLGQLRAELSDRLRKAVYATLEKDYTQLDARTISDRVDVP
jgi:protein required for attachment to host cells